MIKETMEQALFSLFTTSFLVFALVVALAVSVLRNVTETIFRKLQFIIPDKVEDVLKDLWREWILRALPVVVGGLLAFFVVQYPFPVEFAVSVSGRVFFGLIAGLFSSTVYSFVKFHIKKYLPNTIKQKIDDMNPLPLPPAANTDED
jgi:uncharacterized membrane protein YedE/YeeE